MSTRPLSMVLAALLLTAVPAMATEPSAERLRQLRMQAQAHEHGEGVPRDIRQAIRLYCEAAAGGDAEAQYSLGWLYANGRGVRRDDETAAYFFAQAKRQGHVQAANMLRFVGEPTARLPECMQDMVDEQLLAGMSDAQRQAVALLRRLAPDYGISARLAVAVAHTESNLNPQAVSPKNAQGLMQLVPETSQRFNVQKPFDPEQNVRGGLAYLRWLLAYFEGSVPLAVAAYNAGEGAVNQHQGIPPYAETRAYVKRIMSLHQKDRHPFDASVTEPSPMLAKMKAGKQW